MSVSRIVPSTEGNAQNQAHQLPFVPQQNGTPYAAPLSQRGPGPAPAMNSARNSDLRHGPRKLTNSALSHKATTMNDFQVFRRVGK